MASSVLTPLDRKFMRQLAGGPRWMRSFINTFRPLMRRLLETGHIQQVKPQGGKYSNMVGLSAKGAVEMGMAPPTDTQLDRFAERLAEHGDVKLASKEVGCSEHYGRVLLQRIRKQLGWQAQ